MKASEMTKENLAKAANNEIAQLLDFTSIAFLARKDRSTGNLVREVAELKRRLKVAEDALAEIFNKVFVDCEVAEIAKNALAAIREEGGAR